MKSCEMSNSVSEPLKICERKAVRSVRIILIHRVHSLREKDEATESNEEISKNPIQYIRGERLV